MCNKHIYSYYEPYATNYFTVIKGIKWTYAQCRGFTAQWSYRGFKYLKSRTIVLPDILYLKDQHMPTLPCSASSLSCNCNCGIKVK